MFIDAQAGGTIYPCRFVSMATGDTPGSSETYSFKVIEDIVALQMIIGVSQEGITSFPINSTNDMGITPVTAAATSGQNLKVFGVGEVCLIELAGTVYDGHPLKANATTDGKALSLFSQEAQTGASAGPIYCGGIAMQSGVSGQKIRMLVLPFIYNSASS